jgi:hypothetical protein
MFTSGRFQQKQLRDNRCVLINQKKTGEFRTVNLEVHADIEIRGIRSHM